MNSLDTLYSYEVLNTLMKNGIGEFYFNNLVSHMSEEALKEFLGLKTS